MEQHELKELLEEARITDLRAFVAVATQGDAVEGERALDTVADFALAFTRDGKRVSRATLRRCWEMYVALLSCEVEA